VLAVLQGQPAPHAVNAPFIPPEAIPVLGPFLPVGSILGKLAVQLTEGQLESITVEYCGDIVEFDTGPITGAVIHGLLAPISAEPVSLVNAHSIARARGLRITEQRMRECENYTSLITVRITTDKGGTQVAGTTLRGSPHIVQVDDYWIDMIPSGPHWLFIHHRDQPGMIGTVGTLLGRADINISCMYVGREEPRGPATMILGIDEPLGEEERQKILQIPSVYWARTVRL
jgi:D-3-phosphoglycerate dehydrogenase